MPAPNDMNPMTDPSSSEPSVSKRTILVAGLPCDIYGLEELASQQPSLPDHVSVLWLHHPRTRAKEDMAAFAARAVSGWHQRRSENSNLTRGLVAVVFDQRNHGGRLVEERANKAWRGGNQTHAVDMFGAISGMVRDTSGLMDLIGAHLKVEVEGILEGRNTEAGEGGEPVEWKGEVDHHCLLGVSLGGHSAWQTLFAEDRLSTAVVIIGCPDFMALLTNRAKLSKLPTYKAKDKGVSFLGSRSFPQDLVRSCLKHDPKGILFGTGAIATDPNAVSSEERQRLKDTLTSRLAGKKVLLCSGGADKLVPYTMSDPFVQFMEKAAKAWTSEGKESDFAIENKVYDGVGHEFNPEMVQDSLRFLLDDVASVKSRGSKSKI